ncbi:flagellar basal body-associated FliL family protein [Siccirubricoccus sp. KC 17139]|uniref:Flagellar protein FliL n=1 Tax=Siccirubricoccus soli TaxID=2899147 RepID=A0ABT1D8Z6_9PROT|nr:flagellar basal body-associated FliL family protein [Siccirubricoccus soli]MCO6418415.1 flagellar basal body-associated FliL family protein [Siccirubricoccus soli]MCP2684550.1 flagellar basal body-associated FliL family protein [Siccirubricoccus soli]
MAAKPEKSAGATEGEAKPKGGKRKLLLLAAPLLLAAIGAGLWFTGILPGLLGMGTPAAEAAADGHGEAAAQGEGGGHAAPAAVAPRSAVYFDMPDIVANLNAPGRRATYIKLRSKLELTKQEDVPALQQAMPRLLDLFTTYLREMRPEELRGSAGIQRLREELVARASVAAAPARVADVLFLELLVQ